MRRTRRPRPALVGLESRINPGNLTITSALIVDANNNPQPNPVVGEDIYLRAEWETSGLSPADQYVVRFTVDGRPGDSAVLTGDVGTGLTYSWYRNGWWLGPGPHIVVVQVDGANQIAESDETDNTITFQVTPVEPTTLPAKLSLPLGGAPFQDWSIVNYADVDPTSPAYSDFRGGPFTYDDHDAWDITLPNFTHMDAGAPDLAAADGTVIQVEDGHFDRETGLPTGTGNFVMVDHGNGWSTLYYHMMKGSITVKVGDHVTRGEVLGFAASSGRSSDAHLHFTPYYNGCQVETMFDPAAYWIDPPQYQGDLPTSVTDAGMTNESPFDDFKERPPEVDTFSTTTGDDAWFWYRASHFNTGDVIQVLWYQPDGTLNTTYGYTSPEIDVYQGQGWVLPASTWSQHAGLWQVALVVNGDERARATFTVTDDPGVAVIRLSQDTTYVIDGRTTPLDFGSVAAGATAPQQTYTVQNLGSVPLNLSGLSLPPNFSLVGTYPTSIAAGGSSTFTVQLDTAAVGTQWGEIRFATNDPNHPSFHFAVTGTVTGTAPAGAPVLTTDVTARSYTLGLPAVLLDPAATVTDSDSSTFNTGSLTVGFGFGGTPGDVLGIQNAGSGAGQIGVAGSSVTYGGSVIGAVAGGSGGTALVVEFNSNATLAAVQALVRSVTFADADVNAPTNPRRVRFALIDDAGNVGNYASQTVIAYPAVFVPGPKVTLVGPVAPDPRNSAVDAVDLSFSQPVLADTFDPADIALERDGGPNLIDANVSITPLSDGTYRISGLGGLTGVEGTYTLTVSAAGVNDFENVPGSGSESTTWTIDTTAPTVTVSKAPGQADPTNGPVQFTVQFSEPVAGFDGSNVDLSASTTPGTLVASVSGSGPAYTVTVTGMTGDGTVVAAIDAGAVTDLAGNANLASTGTDNAVAFDVTRPTVSIDQASGQLDPSSGTSILFDVAFSEPVSGFVGSDVNLSASTAPGTLTATVTGAGPLYTVVVTGMTGPGTVVASIDASVVTDLAGNPNEASTSADNSVTYVRPGSLQFSAPTYAVDESGSPTLSVTVTRTDGSQGAVSVDYAITGGTATAGADYTVAATGTLTWADGDTTDKTIDVAILDDALSEGKETIDLALSNIPLGGANLGSQTTSSVVIAPSDGVTIQATAKSPLVTLPADADGNIVTIRLGGKVGSFTYFLTNGAVPVSEIDLTDTVSTKSTLSITVKKAKGVTGTPTATVGDIEGMGAAGLKTLSLGKVNLIWDQVAGDGITFNGFVGAVTVGDVAAGADIALNGTATTPRGVPLPARITAGQIEGSPATGLTDISVAAPLASLKAVRIGRGTITAPSVGTIAVTGKAKTRTAAAIPGDLESDITVAGTGLASTKVPALRSLRVAGAVRGSKITVGGGAGTDGNVGTVSVGSFIDSRLFAGYAGPDTGDPAGFNLPATVGSFVVRPQTKAAPDDVFSQSFVIAANFGTVSLGAVDPDNGGTKFGFIYRTALRALTVKEPAFRFDPSGPAIQDLKPSDFEVKKV